MERARPGTRWTPEEIAAVTELSSTLRELARTILVQYTRSTLQIETGKIGFHLLATKVIFES